MKYGHAQWFSTVNGAIGTICSVKYGIDQSNVVDSITIKFDDGKEHSSEKVNSKFQVIEKAFVTRQQFPISSAYAITIHKSTVALKVALCDDEHVTTSMRR